ncbi:MAG: HPr family phosphocarrier protein [Alteromonadaceae bacterium]|nr:HPr family phosphocarrier protein [Alteromonadaceae bacterium]MBL4910503.1 HPr family phosphocarrier protein [Alteromonadaceae bacterium]
MPTFEKTLTIVNKLGLHARAATKLAQLSQQFDATITLTLADKSADAHSIMALMLLAGGQGKSVTIKTNGKDAEQALNSVYQLINDKFEEDE